MDVDAISRFESSHHQRRKRNAPKRYSCYERLLSSGEDTEDASVKRRKKRVRNKNGQVEVSQAEPSIVSQSQQPNANQLFVNEGNNEEKNYGTNAFVCDECGKVLRSKDTLLRHQLSHSGLKPFLCTTCDRGFSSAVSLKEHKARHENKTLYDCSVCSKSFRQNSCYHRHLLMHSKSYSHACNICNRCFSSRDYLRSHMKCHSSERRYKCDKCNKSFARVSDLNRHKILHTGKRPYSCNICGITFADSSSCRRHVKDHELTLKSQQNFACDHCKLSFRKSCLLTQHLLKKHKIIKIDDSSGDISGNAEHNLKDVTPSIHMIQDANFSNDNLLLVEDGLQCPELNESHICESLPLSKEPLHEIDECRNYLETNNYSNLLTLPSSVLKDISAEVGMTEYESEQEQYYPEKSQSTQHIVAEELTYTELSNDFIAFPDFSSQDYYKWLDDFTLLVKMLSFPLNADLFNKIGQVHKTVSDVLADPSCFLFCKETFAKLRGICRDLDQVKGAHLDFVFEHLQE